MSDAPQTARQAWARIHKAQCEAVLSALDDDDYGEAIRRAWIIEECEAAIRRMDEGETNDE